MAVRIDIGIACSGAQIPQWWSPLIQELLSSDRTDDIEIGNVFAISSALPDHNKNHSLSNSPFNEEEKRRLSLTDANRQVVVKRFLEKDSPWLFFLDDDTVPPPGTLGHLLGMGRSFIGGLYFNPKPPFNPIAYIRRPDGLYHTYYGWEHGTVQQVDSIGMGCTLIHRSVFEKIRAEHRVFQRPNGSLAVVHKSRIENEKESKLNSPLEYVKNGYLHQRIIPLLPDDNRPFPFFALEYGRTEDHHFCELADNVGIKPWVDTTILCEHWKWQKTTVDQYKENIGESSKHRPWS